MEFNEKLQQLRKQKGLTQEQLADAVFVSRTAVSKWESGRGYPSIDSLRALADFFEVTVDVLLSSEQLLSVAEVDTVQKQTHIRDIVYGLLDISVAMFFVLPFFGQHTDGGVQAVALLSLDHIAPYLKAVYIAVTVAIAATGILTLALQNCHYKLWQKSRAWLSLVLNMAGVVLFIAGQQPYGAVFLFVFMTIKLLLPVKRQ